MSTRLLSYSDKRKTSDLFVMGMFSGSKVPKDLKKFDPALDQLISSAQSKKRFEGKAGQTLSAYSKTYCEAPEVLVLGLGDKKQYSAKRLRGLLGAVFHTAKNIKATSVRICLESLCTGSVSGAVAAGEIAEFGVLAAYHFDHYKRSFAAQKKKPKALAIELMIAKKSGASTIQKSISKHEIVAGGTLVARNLINEPANVMNAQRMALEAKKEASKRKTLSCQVLGLSEIKRLKMGGVLAVNQGATTPPAFIILEHGKKYKSKGTVCLVGKGVTFDTGGISIKPAKSMEKMKYDMSGAAAVIGTMCAVADLNLPVNVVGITPAVENNVAEDPIRPGDIIRMMNGKSVEVINTDAEGRLILADGLAYSEKYKPKVVIDLATLTGMAAYTFGNQCSAVLGTDSKTVNKLKQAGEASRERCWELPLYEEYAAQMKGHHSDLLNVGGPFGGTITAAIFLKEFVPAKVAWAHLDIAGVAWCDRPRVDCPIGGTGYGVKLLTEYLSNVR